MTRLKHTIAAYLSATLVMIAGCQLSAFEQGTYFIYQIVDESDTPTIDKRLAINSQLFIKTVKSQATSTPKAEEHSEFEMDYNSFGTTANSGFETTLSTNTEVQTTIESSTFNIGIQDDSSLFGN